MEAYVINLVSSPLPSTTSLVYGMYKYISTHPLILNPPVYHTLTGEQVYIEKYRLFNGIELLPGLSCSIFPHYQDGVNPPEPSTTNVSALYQPYDIGGEGIDHAVFHVALKLHYSNVILGNKLEDPYYTTVPCDAVTHPDQILLTSGATKEVELHVNPGADIIGHYLEILRLVIEDVAHKEVYQPYLRVESFEMLFSNLKALPWERKREIYFHEGEAIIRIDGYVSRGWRSRFNCPITHINLREGPQS